MKSVSESAALLGVSDARVRQLIAAAVLPAALVGNRWVIDDGVLTSFRPAPTGRPWQPSAAWGLLWVALDRPVEWLTDKQRQRARQRAANGVSKYTDELRNRSKRTEFSAHPSALERMRADDRIVLSGWSAGSESGADLLVGGDTVEGYVAHKSMQKLKAVYGLTVAGSSPNVVLRVVDGFWPFAKNERIAPAVVVALDLLEHNDQRSNRAGKTLLANALKAMT